MNETKKFDKKNTLVIGIAVATLLLAIIGATYAFFTVTISGGDNPTSVIVKTANLRIVFNSGDLITLNDLVPDDPRLIPPSTDGTKIITVFNDSSINMIYSLLWADVYNSFDDGTSDLMYTVSGSTDGAGTPGQKTTPAMVPDTNGTMIADITILPGETHTYTLKITFPDTSIEQDEQQGKGFAAKITISSPNV